MEERRRMRYGGEEGRGLEIEEGKFER